MKKLIKQIFKFGIVGVIAFVIDYGFLYLFYKVIGINHLLSAALSFTISVVVNYILSIKYVFDVDKEKSSKRNFILFIVFSVIGLGLTELIMYIGVDKLDFKVMLVKIVATAIVMIFNFITRKIFLEKH